ncbi:alpha/beta hydrolase [Rhodococcus erythropolis]|nr:alpha/beta hydrolase [Rhodococcus erythropolis]
MPIDPFLAPLLSQIPEPPEHVEDWDGFRIERGQIAEELVEQLTEPGPSVAKVRTVPIPVHRGEIALRVYTPNGPGPHPVHLFIHGGGWLAGSIFMKAIDIMCRERSALANHVVVSVDYRKAPENKFPTPLDDCYAALCWIADNIEDLGGRADRISVGGGSAGGNLAAAVALKARDENGPSLCLQLLEVPATDLNFTAESHQLFGSGYGLSNIEADLSRRAYLSDLSEADNPYVSPLLAEDLSGLPTAHIMTAEYDVLRDEGEAYAARLSTAGVPVTTSRGAGQVHFSPGLTRAMQASRDWRDEVVDVLNGLHT